MKNSQDLHFVVNFVNGNERERREDKLTRTFDPTGAPTIRKPAESGSTFDNGLRNAAG